LPNPQPEEKIMTIGFGVYLRRRKVSADLVARYKELPVAAISDNMSRLTHGGPRLRPMHSGAPMAGPALTVRTRPGDNLMVQKAIDLAEPGDIIVVDAGGDLTNALIGELLSLYAETRGVGGFVINGAVRDSQTLGQRDFPVFAAGVTHRGPYRNGPGEINVTVAIDGMTIEPGDLIVGDGDGLLCVPYAAAEELYPKAKALAEEELRKAEIILDGKFDRAWVDKALQSLNCYIERE
jgi:RraA family protein